MPITKEMLPTLLGQASQMGTAAAKSGADAFIQGEQAKAQAELQKQKALEEAKAQQRSIERAKALRDYLGGGHAVSVGGVSINPENDLLARQEARQMRSAKITDFDITDPNAVIPSPKDAEEVKASNAGFRSMKETAKGLNQNLSESRGLDRLGAFKVPLIGATIGTQRGRDMDAQIGDLLMQGKNLEKLGALQAPEIALMERMQGSITGLGSLLQDKGEVAKRLQELITRGKSRVEESAAARGYTPQPGALQSDIGTTPKQIKQYSPSRNQTRISADGGKTWKVVDGKQ